jgi:predicted nucleic acid-binding protein
MDYVDTNVILSYLNANDTNHSRAINLWNTADSKITSIIAVLELRSVLARTTGLTVEETEAYVEYLPEIGIHVPDIDMNEVLNGAAEIAPGIRMRTLDLLHISACIEMNAGTFITLDYEFVEKRHVLSDLGISVVSA